MIPGRGDLVKVQIAISLYNLKGWLNKIEDEVTNNASIVESNNFDAVA